MKANLVAFTSARLVQKHLLDVIDYVTSNRADARARIQQLWPCRAHSHCFFTDKNNTDNTKHSLTIVFSTIYVFTRGSL